MAWAATVNLKKGKEKQLQIPPQGVAHEVRLPPQRWALVSPSRWVFKIRFSMSLKKAFYAEKKLAFHFLISLIFSNFTCGWER